MISELHTTGHVISELHTTGHVISELHTTGHVILTPLPEKVAATILHDPFFVPVIRHTASADTRTLSVFIVKNTTFF